MGAVLRIHDISVWIRIRIRGSMPLTNGYGSWIRFLLFSPSFFKDKSQKESQNNRNQGFSDYFCMMIEGSGYIPLTLGSGSGRPKNMLIRLIRIRNTGWGRSQNHTTGRKHGPLKYHSILMGVGAFILPSSSLINFSKTIGKKRLRTEDLV